MEIAPRGPARIGFVSGWGFVTLSVVLFLAACDSSTDISPQPTTVIVTPEQVQMDAVGETRSLSAEVRDQNGDVISDATLEWSSSNPQVAEVSSAGLVSATGSGAAQISAAAGNASGSATVTVEQAATALAGVEGDGQTGAAGIALDQALIVEARDRLGHPVSGVQVGISVEAGEGSVSPSQTTTDSQGRASTTWTLGTTAGEPQRIRVVLIDVPEVDFEFEATAVAGPPHELQKLEGDAQSGSPGSELPETLVVRVTDQFANPVPNEAVTFEVTSGNGSLAETTATTDDEGLASTRWTLGPSEGEQAVRVTAGSVDTSFLATAVVLSTVIGSVSSGNVESVFRPGSPDDDASAPAASVTGSGTIIPGGGALFTVTATQPFTTLYVAVDGQDGYHELDLTAAQTAFGSAATTTSSDLVLTLGEELEEGGYDFMFAVGIGGGRGAWATRSVTVQQVGTGAVQVSVSWDAPSDVDLYVVEPSGETIFFGNPASATGGELDLDSNAACGGPDLRNENITWPNTTPPSGQYTVRVNYWDACNVSQTNWVVTVRVEGQPTRTYTGTFTGPGVGGFTEAGEVVTTFTFGGQQ